MHIYETGLVRMDVSSADKIGLKELQHAVGGYVEVISFGQVLPSGRQLDMYVNEEGWLEGLQENPVASVVAGVFGRSALIVGPAFLASADEEGHALPLTAKEKRFVIAKLEEALNRMDGEVA